MWTGSGKVRLESRTLREPENNEVLTKTRAAGICGTDLHLIEGNFPGCLPLVVPGHEFAGEIVKVGKSVDSTLLGERAGCDSYIGCGKCFYCLKGERHLCREGTCELGINVDGLLMAGRCISGDFYAHSSYRVTGNAVILGSAAGDTAALAVKKGKMPHEI